MAFVKITTTGTLNPIPIPDMGIVGIPHPQVDTVIWNSDTNTPFPFELVRESTDLQDAIDAGHLTMCDDLGNNITDIFTQVPLSSIHTFNGAGLDGLVADPVTENGQFLKDDGTWADPTATQTTVTPNGNLTSTDVQSALEELQSDIDAGTDDQVASEVPVTPVGNISSTDVQAALQELQGDIDAIADTDDQNASEVPYSNTTSGLTATDTQAAIDELDATIDGLGTSSHAIATLASDGVTQDSLDLTGQEIKVNLATATTDGVMSATDKFKLNNIEDNATADQTAAEIKTAYESNANTNVFTDFEKSKLLGVESNAKDDQIATEVPYTPTTTADWDVTPTEVGGSLDELAQRIDDLEDAPAFTDELVKVSANDTTGGLLGDKLVTTTPEVSIVEVNDGSNETLRLNVDLSAYELTGHTHTASEITDFDTEVSNNTDVTANTNARHSAVTLGGVANDTTDDTLDLTGQVLTVNAVTTTTDGAMIASDKLKLDGIEAGATGDQTAGEIKTAYESNANTNAFTDADETKLDGIEALATADQIASEVPFTPNGDIVATDVQAAIQELRDDTDTKLGDKIDVSEKGAANGVATLDGSGQIPAGQLPSYVDDVLEYANLGAFPVTGETGKIYVAINTGKTYRWTGTIYTEISASEVISVNGETGVVVISTGDITEDANSRFVTDADLTTLSNTSNTNTGDEPTFAGAGTDGVVPDPVTETGKVLSDNGTWITIEGTDDQVASEVPYTPTGNTVATDVQGAITELQTEIDSNTAASHAALTLDIDLDTTEQAANLVGQELELLKATVSTDGVMSSEDKAKLDAILGTNTGDEVEEYANFATFPPTGTTGIIYVDEATGDLYIWDGASYQSVGGSTYVHPNHTGEVTSVGDGAQTLDKTAITNKTEVDPEAGDYLLISDSSDSDNLKKVDASHFISLSQKVGCSPVGDFVGNPKSATVTFTTAFPDTNYGVSLVPIMSDGSKNFVVTAFDKTATGFKISLNSNSTVDLIEVCWVATEFGEY